MAVKFLFLTTVQTNDNKEGPDSATSIIDMEIHVICKKKNNQGEYKFF